MKRHHTSYAFLMEMIGVCALFLVCASIFVMVFAKAETVSRQADLLNQAVLAASNAMEETFAQETAADSKAFSTESFFLTIQTEITDGLMNVTVQVIDSSDGSTLYTLNGARAVSKGGHA